MGAGEAAKPQAMDPVQRALFMRTPAVADRILYLGAGGAAFSEAARTRNPRADVLFDASDPAPVDVLTVDDLGPLLADPAGAELLQRTYVLVSAIPAGEANPGALLADLTARGFTLLQLRPVDEPGDYFDDCAQDLVAVWQEGRLPAEPPPWALIVVARRGEGRARMLVSMLTFAPTLMDIRTRLPAMAMRSEPELLIQHAPPPARLPPAPIGQPKVVVLQRPGPPVGAAEWHKMMLDLIRGGWVAIIEYDDHPELAARTNDRQVLPTDWIRFSCVHAVQTSTPALRDLFLQHNAEVRLLPNAAFRLEAFPEHLPRRVFYGAVARGAHSVEVARSLGPAIAQFPDLEFVVVGDPAVFEALPTARKHYHEILAYEDYLKLMATCAISLSPIEPSEQNAAKSDAKFLDAAARGVLTIASPTIYADVIRHGENGLIAPQVADWAPMLAEALHDDDARRRMARNAWQYVRDGRMFADQIKARHDWYRELWERRVELNTAVLARIRG